MGLFGKRVKGAPEKDRTAVAAAPESTGGTGERSRMIADASALFLAGRMKDACAACHRALAAGHESADVYRILGWASLWTDRLDDAERWLRKAVATDPSQWSAEFGLGTTLRTLKRYAEAAACFDRALALQPQSVPTLINLGACQLDLERFAEAEHSMRRAIAVDSGSAPAWTNLGVALARQDRHEEAVEAYWLAEGIERKSGAEPENFVNFGTDLREAGHTSAALELWESHLAQRSQPTAQAQYALGLLGAGRMREGWSHFEFRWLKEPLNS